MAIQWHPLFARLLRPLLEKYYEVLTNVAVGDVPREADLVILRRTATESPFLGLWRHLRPWNLLEYKGRSVSPRLEHIDHMVEVGLGIHRRLNSERARNKQPQVPASDMCFWYIVNYMGKRFRRAVAEKLGVLELLGEGVWRGRAMDRDVLLVSGSEVPIETDSLPLHILGRETPEQEAALARLVTADVSLWDPYAQYLGSFHPNVLKELEVMARTAKKKLKLDLQPIIDFVGVKNLIDEVGIHKVIKAIGVNRVIDEVGSGRVIDELGLGRVIDEVGLGRVIDEVGPGRLIDELGKKRLTPEERAKLKRQLEKLDARDAAK